MAHGQDYSRAQKGIINRYYDNRDTIMIQKLQEFISDLFLCEDDKKADKLWESVKTALANTQANKVRVEKLLAERNLQELAKVVGELTVPGKAAAEPPRPAPPAAAPIARPAAPVAGATPAPPPAPAGPEELKAALKAFKKRLKLTRLDEESKLGRSPMTNGSGSSRIIAIVPPNQYPRAVWEELVAQGKLRKSGRDFYELVEP